MDLFQNLVLLVFLAMRDVLAFTTGKASCELFTKHASIIYDCSTRGLTAIPSNIPSNVTELNLSKNRVKAIPNMSFTGLSSLQKLDLSQNYITGICPEAFIGAPNLEVLNLQYNRIVYEELPSDIFQNSKKLKTIHLEGQDEKYPSREYPSSALKDLQYLEDLGLDLLENQSFGEEFSTLISLRTLHLKSTSERHLHENTFAAFANVSLVTLDLGSCHMQQINTMAFVYFKHLQNLYLYDNFKLGLNGSTFPLRYLNSPLKLLNLQTVYHYNRRVVFSEEIMKNMQHLPIENLTISGNFLKGFDSGLYKYLPHLKYLDFGGNQVYMWDMSQWSCWINFIGLTNLTILKVHEEPQWQQKMIYNPKVKSDHCSNRPKVTVNISPRLEYLDLSGAFPTKIFTTSLFINPNNQLKYLDISSQSNMNIFPVVCDFYGLNKLETFNIANNELSFIASASYLCCPNLKTLILGGNKIKSLHDNGTSFLNLENLETLDLSNNGISSLSNQTFSKLKNVKNLTVNQNKIQQMPSLNMANVRIINLAENYLSSPNIPFPSTLESLNLNHNNIPYLTKDVIRSLERQHVTINLLSNKFNCSNCNALDFLTWIQNKSKMATVLDMNKYTCTDKGFKNKLLIQVNISELSKKLKCDDARDDTDFFVYLSVGSILVIAFLVTVSGLVYRYRWHIKYWIILTGNRAKYKKLESVAFRYDAFVCYSTEDRAWVHDILASKLERRVEGHSYKLCLHCRDWLPGATIEDNVIEAIQQSRHTILVISRNFIQSQWCIFEMHMARSVFHEEARDVLILVLLEDVPLNQSSLTLTNLLKTKTYLQWTTDEMGQALFWLNMRSALTNNSAALVNFVQPEEPNNN